MSQKRQKCSQHVSNFWFIKGVKCKPKVSQNEAKRDQKAAKGNHIEAKIELNMENNRRWKRPNKFQACLLCFHDARSQSLGKRDKQSGENGAKIEATCWKKAKAATAKICKNHRRVCQKSSFWRIHGDPPAFWICLLFFRPPEAALFGFCMRFGIHFGRLLGSRVRFGRSFGNILVAFGRPLNVFFGFVLESVKLWKVLFYYSTATLLRGAGGAGWTDFWDFGVTLGVWRAIGSLLAAGGCHWSL